MALRRYQRYYNCNNTGRVVVGKIDLRNQMVYLDNGEMLSTEDVLKHYKLSDTRKPKRILYEEKTIYNPVTNDSWVIRKKVICD